MVSIDRSRARSGDEFEFRCDDLSLLRFFCRLRLFVRLIRPNYNALSCTFRLSDRSNKDTVISRLRYHHSKILIEEGKLEDLHCNKQRGRN